MIYYPPIGFSPSFLRFCRSSPFELEHGGAYELLVGGSFTSNVVVCLKTIEAVGMAGRVDW